MNDLIRIEREVIRNIIINPEYMNALDLRDNNFSDVGCKLIFQKINKLQNENKPIDLLTIAEGFKREGFFDFIKGIMEENIVSKELNVLVEYSEVLKKNSIMRIVKSKAKVLQELDDFDKLVQTVNEMPQDANYSSSSDEMNSYDGAMDFYKRLNQKKEYIKTGFPTIDKLTYIQKGDLIVVGARPSVGKTAFSLQMMSEMAEKYNCVYFSLETSKEKIYDRLMATTSGIRMENIKTGNLDNFDKEKLIKGIEDVQKKNITVVSAGSYNVEEIRAKSLKLKADIIFIDYLGLITASGKDAYHQVTKLSKELHNMAQKYKITVVVLSQLRRNNENKPRLEDLRDSGQLEQDADLVFLLHDDKEYNCYWTIIAKNKEGKTGEIKQTFYKDIQKFMEVK